MAPVEETTAANAWVESYLNACETALTLWSVVIAFTPSAIKAHADC